MNGAHKYDDIINLPYRKSERHPQMPRLERAAQFAPYAALTGYEEVIENTRADAADRMLNEVEHVRE